MSKSERTNVRTHDPVREGDGFSVTWQRTVAGTDYAFNLVTMPGGEKRVFASRFNGYPGGERFACAWDQAAEFTFRTDGTVRTRRYPPRTDHYWTRDAAPERQVRTARTR